MSQWQKRDVPGSASDPLANYQGVPILGQQRDSAYYVGRVIVELWEPESGLDDSYSFACSIEAVNGDNKSLLRRVAAALPARVKRDLNKLYP